MSSPATRPSPSPCYPCSTAASSTRSRTSGAAARWAGSWYTDGKLLRKKNTFTDFIAAACARHLAEAGWTSADRLVARGGSAGGLLMGAVANMAPDAFAGIVAHVPFVDALTTILDPVAAADRDRVGGSGATRCTTPRFTRT